MALSVDRRKQKILAYMESVGVRQAPLPDVQERRLYTLRELEALAEEIANDARLFEP